MASNREGRNSSRVYWKDVRKSAGAYFFLIAESIPVRILENIGEGNQKASRCRSIKFIWH